MYFEVHADGYPIIACDEINFLFKTSVLFRTIFALKMISVSFSVSSQTTSGGKSISFQTRETTISTGDYLSSMQADEKGAPLLLYTRVHQQNQKVL